MNDANEIGKVETPLTSLSRNTVDSIWENCRL